MHKGPYYKLLGLPTNATDREIRKRYRQLAMRYHPDRNPDPNAEELFIKLTEAYEILLDKSSTPESTRHKGRSSQEEKEERIKKARQRYAEQVIKERLENERYFKFLTQGRKWKTIRWATYIGIALSVLLIADRFLPHHFEEEEITRYSLNVAYGPNGKQISLIETNKDNYYWISRMTYSLYGKTRHIYVESSWLFHNPIRIISRGKISYKYFNLHFTAYYSYQLLILIFLVPLFTMSRKRKSVRFTLLYHLSYYGVTSVMIIFLISGNRWAHLLTLGFF